MSSPYRFKLDQRVIVKEPNECEYSGVIAHRRKLPGFDDKGRVLVRYMVLDDADNAHTLIPGYWIRPDEQMELTDPDKEWYAGYVKTEIEAIEDNMEAERANG